MRFTQGILKKKQVVKDVSLESMNTTLLNLEVSQTSLESFVERNDQLEAAKSVINPNEPSAQMLAGILIDSMGYGSNISLESMATSPMAALEAAQEENIDKAREESSKFSSGLIGWIKKVVSERGRIFTQLDAAINEVEKYKGKKFKLKDASKFETSLSTYTDLSSTLTLLEKTFSSFASIHLARIEASVNALKNDTDPVRIYDKILADFYSNSAALIPTVIDRRPLSEVNTAVVEKRISGGIKIGKGTFFGVLCDLDIGDLSKDGKLINNPQHIAYFFNASSKNNFITFSEILNESKGKLPETFDELHNILIKLRELMDNVIDVNRLNRFKSISEQSQNLLKSKKVKDADVMADFMINANSFAACSTFFKSSEENFKKVAKEILSLAQEACKSITE